MATISSILESNRKLALQIDGSNPAINFKEYKVRGIVSQHIDLANVLYQLIQKQELEILPEADPEEVDEKAKSRKKTVRIFCPYESPNLAVRILKAYKETKMIQEEQGINVLYAGLGMLEWKDAAQAEKSWRSPLVMVPMEIEKLNTLNRHGEPMFRLSYSEEGVEPNYALIEALMARFGISLQEMPKWEEYDTIETLRTAWDQWLEELSENINGKDEWKIDSASMVLSLFSFSKIMMYKDLEAEKWCTGESPDGPALITALLKDGFRKEKERFSSSDKLDEIVSASLPVTVLDMDSSQAKVILEAEHSECLVVQGPPGTGKSQTIANLIAAAVLKGEKVLFVSEKMAALEVVKRRLVQAGLEAGILELHGSKTKKSAFLEDMRKAIETTYKASAPKSFTIAQLENLSKELNEWSHAVNTPLPENGYTPHELYGYIIQNQQSAEESFPSLHALSNRVTEFLAYVKSVSKAAIGTPSASGPDINELSDFQGALQVIGHPMDHPFWGIELMTVPLSLNREIEESISESIECLNALCLALEPAAKDFPWLTTISLESMDKVTQMYHLVLSVPNGQFLPYAEKNWVGNRDFMDELINIGISTAALKSETDALLTDASREVQLDEERLVLATTSDNFFTRRFNSRYKATRKKIFSLFRNPAEAKKQNLLKTVDNILEYRAKKKQLAAYDERAAGILGVLWQQENTSWTNIGTFFEWMISIDEKIKAGIINPGFTKYVSAIVDLQSVQNNVAIIERERNRFLKAISHLKSILQIRGAIYDEWRTLHMIAFRDRLERMLRELDKLPSWVQYYKASHAYEANNKGWVNDIAQNWKPATRYLTVFIKNLIWEKLLEQAYQQRPVLQTTGRQKLDRLREDFKEKDQELQKYYKAALINRHTNAVQEFGNSGESGFVRRNLQRKRNIPPIRIFLREAFSAITAIKPVFMMSPLSVASYLEAKPELFDLAIFDEASQIEPVDAYGAILRAKKVVVAGDTKQMPPTNFFKNTIAQSESEGEEDESGLATDIESIMQMLLAQGAKCKSLDWHYRSQHESLIAVSNRNFYENRLLVYPSAFHEHDFLGLKIKLLSHEECPYEGEGQNSGEAKTVARAVLEFARTHPDKSLGVVAFNVKQRDLIDKEINQLARAHTELNTFINKKSLEPFFIKNLENVQGDERDAIYISIGFGKSVKGVMGYKFGPLNNEGGERRLNVLISRARMQNIVFTNFSSNDMDLSRTGALAVKALKEFLYYAEYNKELHYEISGEEADSIFEEQVNEDIKRMGFDTALQIGCRGYRIDIGVKHPDRPGQFILAIECDGATYHSSKSARDRDRLRQTVLEGFGWQFYRIWSTNWFQNRSAEIEKLKAEIENAIQKANLTVLSLSSKQSSPEPVSVLVPGQEDIHLETVKDVTLNKFAPYVMTNTKGWGSNHDILSMNTSILERYFLEVISTEGPIHIDNIIDRVAKSQNVQRVGQRIRAHLEKELSKISKGNIVVKQKEFFWIKDKQHVLPRSYSNVDNKEIDLIAPHELDAAFIKVINAAFSITDPELVTTVADRLGFNRVTARIRESLKAHLKIMISNGRISKENGLIRKNSISSK